MSEEASTWHGCKGVVGQNKWEGGLLLYCLTMVEFRGGGKYFGTHPDVGPELVGPTSHRHNKAVNWPTGEDHESFGALHEFLQVKMLYPIFVFLFVFVTY